MVGAAWSWVGSNSLLSGEVLRKVELVSGSGQSSTRGRTMARSKGYGVRDLALMIIFKLVPPDLQLKAVH
jgi:hypothetical protein